MTEERNGPERRKTIKHDIALTVEEAVEERVSKAENKLMMHMDVKFSQIQRIFDQHVIDAFPPGGVHKHREHHQSLIDSAEVAKRIKQDLVAWIIKGSVGIVFVLIGMGALEWLQRELAK